MARQKAKNNVPRKVNLCQEKRANKSMEEAEDSLNDVPLPGNRTNEDIVTAVAAG